MPADESLTNELPNVVTQIPSDGSNLRLVELDLLVKSLYQPRLRPITKKDVGELMQSLSAVGQTTPIVVTPSVQEPGKFCVHQGERRWRAAQFLGWSQLEAIVREDLDGSAVHRMALADNLSREDLTAWEQANALDEYCISEGLGVEAAAEELGVSRATAFRLKAILSASEDLRAIFANSTMAARPADLLAKIESKAPKKALSLARRLVDGQVGMKTLESELAKEKGSRPRTAARRDVELIDNDRSIDLRIHLIKGSYGEEHKRRVIAAVGELFATLQVNMHDLFGYERIQSPAESEMEAAY